MENILRIIPDMVKNKVIIITGNKGEGKTTKLQRVVKLLKKENISMSGFSAYADLIDGDRNGYTLVDIVSSKSIILCVNEPCSTYEKIGRFYFNPLAIKFGQKLLNTNPFEKTLIVIDEVGPFELQNKIWHDSLLHQLGIPQNIILLIVRTKLVDEIIKKFNIGNANIHTLSGDDMEIVNEIKMHFCIQ
ncbi:MAG: hypothetical protein HQ521_17070 [Bacteroidetes bacterium]|nr:hypothetical protein [Bacteroidota bacterium]